jgi:8-oxo-dGTP diphosphatase
MDRVLGTLVYARRDIASDRQAASPFDNKQVLMLHRNKEPNKGLWVAPGGKVEMRESPFECAIREMREETGLIVKNLTLRGVVSEVSPRDDYQWLLFIFITDNFGGKLIQCSEGNLAWMNVDAISLLPIPQADAIFFPHIINEKGPLYQAKYSYDSNLRLVQVEEFTTDGQGEAK